ncbi:SGNH/GDSL hydrolase family protein [Rossellomorea vietnamensis]|uniref:SGNH/GDSL hydrolase family protein n=1 Tax=Rossellomorea vietnamensis TaxID=218284 RepID=A0A5D4M3C1_9BACI|nr:SGNH/GDSL hydrolase family protein [Rossellomorea vietnamensis]TYR95898.1 SGNH/GDSL hydrolase family protein [Rossellomorea vietnamensis]
MKNFLLVLFTVLSTAFLLFGYSYYQERTNISSLANSEAETGSTANLASKEEPVKEETETDISQLVSNWPEEAQQNFLDAVEAGEVYKVAIVGSQAMGTGENGWSEQLQAGLTATYGEGLEIELFEYDTTSIEFINSPDSQEVIDFSPDMVLFEPFSLNDNSGGVAPSDNHVSIEMFQSSLLGANEEASLILQPTHPLYGATYYPIQVEDLQQFAEEMDITYLNHWQAWPDTDDETLEDYLSSSKEEPSEQGHEVWADFLLDYFIAE